MVPEIFFPDKVAAAEGVKDFGGVLDLSSSLLIVRCRFYGFVALVLRFLTFFSTCPMNGRKDAFSGSSRTDCLSHGCSQLRKLE